jgi:hypothetical protein
LFRIDFARVILLAGALGCCADAAWAVLGQAVSAPAASVSPATPARRLAAASTPLSGLYSVQEVVLETGTAVQEYSNAAGVVFAVTWRGPVLPNLSILLGNYFSIFKAETQRARATGKRGSPVSVQREDLVVSSRGRMGSFVGYAFAPALIPAGVSVNDVLE